MKLLVLMVALTFAGFSHAEETNVIDSQEVFVEIDGQLQSLEVDAEGFEALLATSRGFYECRPVGDGWRRCSKNTGRCFGAVYPHKFLCDDALEGGGGER